MVYVYSVRYMCGDCYLVLYILPRTALRGRLLLLDNPTSLQFNLAPGYIEGNSWVMRIKSSHWSNLGAEVTTHYNVLASKRLKFSYVVGPRDWHMEDAVEKYITCTDQPPENVQESQ